MATLNNRWVSADEVSKHLGVSKDTVYRWIEKRGLPAHRVGRRLWKFQLSEVDEWVKRGGADTADTATKKRKQKGEGRRRSVRRER